VRASLLTGLRPDSTEIWSNGSRHQHFREHLPDIVTLPQQFKNHGYRALAFGKIYHGAFAVRNKWNDPASWSDTAWLTGPRYYYTEEGVSVAREVFAKKTKARGYKVDEWVNHFVLGLSHEAPDVDNDVLQDGQIAARGIKALREVNDEPFFLALGFLKPHLPFIAPKKYWDMYPPEKVEVAPNRYPPKDAPPFASTTWGHPRTYTDFPNKGEPPEELVRELTRGYAACVSYVDAQVGRVLDELDDLGLRDNTIVVLWGDHGWHIGENHIWGKATNFELSTRSPLIVCDPRMKAAGSKTDALVEFVDIYPTLCELASLPNSLTSKERASLRCSTNPIDHGKPRLSASTPTNPIWARRYERIVTALHDGRGPTPQTRLAVWSFTITSPILWKMSTLRRSPSMRS